MNLYDFSVRAYLRAEAAKVRPKVPAPKQFAASILLRPQSTYTGPTSSRIITTTVDDINPALP